MRIVSHVLLVFAITFCIIQISPACASANYRARILDIKGEANSVNNACQIVGSMYVADEQQSHAFFWSQSTGVIDLGPGWGNDINSEGRAVGTAYINGTYYAFSWKYGESIHYLGEGGACAINDSGMIAWDSISTCTPMLWKPSGEQIAVPVSEGCCRDINNNGVITGYTNRTYTWSEGMGLHMLPLVPAGQYAWSDCINDNGQIAGYITGGDTWACTWLSDHSSMSYLAKIGLNSIALGINNKGQIVGYYGTGYNACLWDTDGTVVDLASLVTPTFRSKACSINKNGVIVGFQDSGLISNSTNVVIWEPVPEPSSICGFAVGLVGCIYRLRIRRRR